MFAHADITQDIFEEYSKRNEIIKDKCSSLLSILKRISGTENYRGGDNFKVGFMRQFGHTVNTIGLKGFTTRHGFDPSLGSFMFDPKKLNPLEREAYFLGAEVFRLIAENDQTGDGQFVMTVTIMTPDSSVGRHRDSRDIGPQMLLSLGDFDGGAVRCFDEQNTHYVDLVTKNNPTLCDGRLDHYVLPIERGIRYGVFVYRMNDDSLSGPSPILDIVQNDPRKVRIEYLPTLCAGQSPIPNSHRVAALDKPSTRNVCASASASVGPTEADDVFLPVINRNLGSDGIDPLDTWQEIPQVIYRNVCAERDSISIQSLFYYRVKCWPVVVESFADRWLNSEGPANVGPFSDIISHMLSSVNGSCLFPTQEQRPSLRAVVDTCKRLFTNSERIVFSPQIARCLVCTVSAHSKTYPNKDAISRLELMGRDEFVNTFANYRSARAWDVTTQPGATGVFRDVVREMSLCQIGDGKKVSFERADEFLHLWRDNLRLGIPLSSFEASLNHRNSPHLIRGPLFRILLVVLFHSLGVISNDGQIESWLPKSLTKDSGSKRVCCRMMSIDPGEVREYIIAAAQRIGVVAYNYENVLCKLAVAFFRPYGLFELCE